jgi:hypothetical protein
MRETNRVSYFRARLPLYVPSLPAAALEVAVPSAGGGGSGTCWVTVVWRLRLSDSWGMKAAVCRDTRTDKGRMSAGAAAMGHCLMCANVWGCVHPWLTRVATTTVFRGHAKRW